MMNKESHILEKYKKEKSNVVSAMFVPVAVAMIFSTLAGYIATTIDGLITSNYLGPDAYSAVSLFSPVVNFIILLVSFIAVGGQVLCSAKVGAGERDSANSVFSFSVIVGLGITALFLLVAIFTPDLIFSICGASGQKQPVLHANMAEYLKGFLYGVPAFILVQVLSPFLLIDNRKRLISISASVLCISDVTGDLLNVFVFHGGVFGMGFATSVSFVLQLLVLLTHFVSKKSFFGFSMKGFKASYIKEILKSGLLNFMRTIVTVGRDLFTNHMNLAVALSTAAVAAKGIQYDLNVLMFCLSIGIGKALLPMTSMYYGADDRKGLKRLFACSMQTSTVFAGGMGIVLFVLAPVVARAYTADQDVISLAVFSIRCMAAGLIFDTTTSVFQDYLQGIQRIKLVNVICFFDRLLIPVAAAWILGMRFGSKGVMAAIAASKLILAVLLFILVCIVRKGLPAGLGDFMFLPEDFGTNDGSELYSRIMTIDDVVLRSDEARQFCLAHGADETKAFMMALYVEEMAGNTIRHGKPRSGKNVSVDFRVYIKDETICLTLRDYCEAFDPTEYYKVHQFDDPESNIGIRMVMKLAKDVRYFNAFNSNCTMILLD